MLRIDGILLCTRQRIGLQGHQRDNIDFAYDEGNFIAVLRLLAKSNNIIKESNIA